MCNLDDSCDSSLNTVHSANISVSVRDEALDTACTEGCAGRLADWLLNDCSSRFNSTKLYYLCLQTEGNATVARGTTVTTPSHHSLMSIEKFWHYLKLAKLYSSSSNVQISAQCSFRALETSWAAVISRFITILNIFKELLTQVN